LEVAKVRSTSYNREEVFEKIIARIAQGEALTTILRTEGMPHYSTVCDWLSEDAALADRYTRARLAQADLLTEEMLEEARMTTAENAQAKRLLIDVLKWRAGKLRPKVYGDKLDVTSDGEKISGFTTLLTQLKGNEPSEE
jgi:hypothetical protein